MQKILKLPHAGLMFLAIFMSLSAAGQYSARTMMWMGQTQSSTSFRMPAKEEKVSCWIDVSDENTCNSLCAKGVRINAREAGLVVAEVPRSQVLHLGEIAGVKHVAIATPMTLCNDSARSYTHVDAIHAGLSFPRQYTGRGVVVGIIDTGVDFNHISMFDANGVSRVRAAYLPQDTTGVSPVIEGDTLRGSHYCTPEQIASLTSDCAGSHGTHTAGIAAGGYMGNPYYGAAPEADLVLCAMPLLYDTDIAASIKYITDYATRVGKPCVISMSFSSQEGAHDGSSFLCRLFESMSGPGRLFVISAGNDGDQQIFLNHNFNSAAPDTLRTYIDSYYSREHFSGFLSGWSSTEKPHTMELSVIDYSTSKELITLPFPQPVDSYYMVSLDTLPELAPYFTGVLLGAAAVEENGRFHSVLQMDITVTQPNYRLGVKVSSEDDGMFRMWSSGVMMLNAVRVPGYTTATKAGSISDLATGDGAISVGAFCTRSTIPFIEGEEQSISKANYQDLCYFSSYGPDANGVTRPDICAPGQMLVSAGNRYDPTWASNSSRLLVCRAEANGEQYPFYGQQGTSMSAPFVAGSIALWLQARPDLTVADVRQILDSTAVVDSFVEAKTSQRWGRGKIDADAGLRYLLQELKPRNKFDMNDDCKVDVTDVSLMISFILGEQVNLDKEMCDVNGDGKADVSDVSLEIDYILGKITDTDDVSND